MAKCPREINDELYRDEWQSAGGRPDRHAQHAVVGSRLPRRLFGVLHYTDKDGNLVKIEGDPKSPIYNGRLCMRCLAVPEAVSHHSRLYNPLKRVGERGESRESGGNQLGRSL